MALSPFRADLCWARLDAGEAGEVLSVLSAGLLDRGFVRPSFEAAVRAREQVSPTGLPLAGRKVAIPHADPEHVIAPAVALCTLARPVPFREMGDPAREVLVDLVAMLAFPDHDSAQTHLVGLLQRFQDGAFVERLWAAPDPAALAALLRVPETGA